MATTAAIVTCALTGVLTDPKKFPVPVTPEEMAKEALDAYNAGAAAVHVHFRNQEDGLGHLPTWDVDVASDIIGAIRAAAPKILINCSTGVFGPDISGPLAVLERVRPELAAMNAGSLNYLRARSNGQWAWPPLMFGNPVEKIQQYLDVMYRLTVIPECECVDTGIVRTVAMGRQVGMLKDPVHVSFVMGVGSGMPAKSALLPLLVEELPAGARFQSIVIGRDEVWDVHKTCCELGGDVRTGLEDTFYLPNGERVGSNGALVEALVNVVRSCGREPATPEQARDLMGLGAM